MAAWSVWDSEQAQMSHKREKEMTTAVNTHKYFDYIVIACAQILLVRLSLRTKAEKPFRDHHRTNNMLQMVLTFNDGAQEDWGLCTAGISRVLSQTNPN